MNISTSSAKHYQPLAFISVLLLTSLYNGPGDGFIILALCWCLLTGILLVQLCQAGVSEFSLPVDRVSILFYLLIVFFLLNLFTTQSASHTIFALWAYLIPFFTFLLWRRNNLFHFLDLWNGIFFFGIVSAVFAIIDFFINDVPYTTGQRVDPNTFADLMICIISPAVALYLSRDLSKTVLKGYEAGLFTLVLALLLSDSRAGVLLWLASISIILLYCLRQKTMQPKRINRLILVLGISVTFFLMVPGNQYSIQDLKTSDDTELSSVDTRLKMWSSTWEMIQQEPIVGSGLGTFALKYPAHRSPEEFITSGTTPHNDYLQLLQEGGVIIFLLFCCLMLATLYYFFILFFDKKKTSNSDQTLYFSLSVSTTCLAIHALINFVFVTPMLMTFTALYLAEICRVKSQQKYILPFKRLNSRLASMIIGVIVIFPVVGIVADSVIDNLYNPSSITHKKLPLIETSNGQSLMNKAILLSDVRDKNIFSRSYITQQLNYSIQNTNNPETRGKIAKLLVNEYGKYIDSCELCSQPYIKLANHYDQFGENALAEKYYQMSLAIDPTKINHQLDYAKSLIKQDRSDQAKKMLEEYRDKWGVFLKKRHQNQNLMELEQLILNLK